MNFQTSGKKATQAVARLIERSGSPIDYLRVVKLVYLADRKSIIERGIPIVGGTYFSMTKGPTISEVMNFVNRRNAPGWRHYISPRHGNEVRLMAKPDFGALSAAEIEILDSVVHEHSLRTTEELVDWCHNNCAEYEEVSSGRKPIQVESILKAAGKSAASVRKTVREAESVASLDAMLA